MKQEVLPILNDEDKDLMEKILRAGKIKHANPVRHPSRKKRKMRYAA
jgi:hypothetical protein